MSKVRYFARLMINRLATGALEPIALWQGPSIRRQKPAASVTRKPLTNSRITSPVTRPSLGRGRACGFRPSGECKPQDEPSLVRCSGSLYYLSPSRLAGTLPSIPSEQSLAHHRSRVGRPHWRRELRIFEASVAFCHLARPWPGPTLLVSGKVCLGRVSYRENQTSRLGTRYPRHFKLRAKAALG